MKATKWPKAEPLTPKEIGITERTWEEMASAKMHDLDTIVYNDGGAEWRVLFCRHDSGKAQTHNGVRLATYKEALTFMMMSTLEDIDQNGPVRGSNIIDDEDDDLPFQLSGKEGAVRPREEQPIDLNDLNTVAPLKELGFEWGGTNEGGDTFYTATSQEGKVVIVGSLDCDPGEIGADVYANEEDAEDGKRETSCTGKGIPALIGKLRSLGISFLKR